VSFAFSNSEVNRQFTFAFSDPYYTIDGVSRGFSAYYRETDAAEANVSDYLTDVWGGSVSYGIPVNEFDRVLSTLKYENTTLHTTGTTPTQIEDFVESYGTNYNTFGVELGWAHDTRNTAIFPERGTLQRLSAEVIVPGSDLTYYTLNYFQQLFFPLPRKLVFTVKGEVGYGDGYGDTDELPFFQNFYAGGIRTVRGFKTNTLGPRDSNDNPFGGSLKTVGTLQLVFPSPIKEQEDALRWGVFVDAGNVFGPGDGWDVGEIRASAGVDVKWLTPIGPVTFALAQPFIKKSEDDIENFQFTLGIDF
jgi:outer membrane protein insertion porin family